MSAMSMVWVLVAVLAGPNYTDVPTYLGTYATQEDCQRVVASMREIQDIRPSRFKCVSVQRVS